ncbi:probable tRNA (uracil-O(2)-)-methyltransferase [Nannospalax galili]|uniref:probable tRNA (uracil-O(2)-)-methyltransferase n=1 Tax=Nannospalax galili TaxID=1026970 RepID=UPI00111C10F6|nr:probable tRNA (uracil-O(2)-)-methyltransferase [Nannospalax galili]
MAELGRVRLRDPRALLPAGFWAAVAVWLERPHVANKRLCGARLEARGSAVLPRAEPGERGPEAGGPQRGQGPQPEERGSEGRGPQRGQGPQPEERGPEAGGPQRGQGPQPEERGPEVGGPQRGQGPQPEERGAGERGLGSTAGPEGDAPAANLDALWDRLSRLALGRPEVLAFLLGPAAEPQPAAQRELVLVLRTVIPKASPHCRFTAPRREVVVQDVPSGTVTFLPLEEDAEGNVEVKMSNIYQIQLRHSEGEWFMSILIFCPERWHSDGVVYPTPAWLGEELLARLARWAVENRKSEFKSTLSLVSVTRYSRMYQELKEKYRDMVKVWPEVTDPAKFVYEDVAIATYLLILWEEERAQKRISIKQSFVDLGCGNGLLVHILSSEGHPGRGIDVRRRKIWDMYGPHTQLEEGSITPSDKTLFPGVDWLIGNHSDELTPWIPVIAARSSYDCRFFVLPCCFFDFAGRYRRRQSRKTQYREYLDFVLEVGLSCGFHVQEDCLRIPSTKRVCLIGTSRTYPPAAEVWMDQQRMQYLQRRQGGLQSPPGEEHTPPTPQATACDAGHRDSHMALDAGAEYVPEVPAAEHGGGALASGPWLPGFRPREKVECVRNCAALPRDFIDQVVLQVANLLLDGKKLNPGSSLDPSVKAWNGGGSLSLAEVAGELNPETLRRLKRECGGLQTLLRNCHQVFEVLNGRVHIRDWRQELQKEKSEARRSVSAEAFKTRTCWFFIHHPDGCVLPATLCPFAHGPGELRPSQAFKKQRQAP